MSFLFSGLGGKYSRRGNMMHFRLFRKNNVKAGERIDLVLDHRRYSIDGDVLSMIYSICPHGKTDRIGECDLRVGMNEELFYAGNIGYRIYEPFRGRGYAYDACLMLLQIAKKEFRMKEVLITCSPENTPSRKTIEKAGFQYIDTVNVPADHYLYRRGEKVKNRYMLNL